MYLPKLRELGEALGALFSAPATTRFPAEPYTPPDAYRGFPRFDAEECVGCGACAQVCPAGAIAIDDDLDSGVRTLRLNLGPCIQCGLCHEKCTTGGGIAPTTTYALPLRDPRAAEAFQTVEKELAVCELCGAAIAPWDQLDWVRERLGARAYAHPTLLLSLQRRYTGIPDRRPKERIRREDYLTTACPRCRYQIVMADDF